MKSTTIKHHVNGELATNTKPRRTMEMYAGTDGSPCTNSRGCGFVVLADVTAEPEIQGYTDRRGVSNNSAHVFELEGESSTRWIPVRYGSYVTADIRNMYDR